MGERWERSWRTPGYPRLYTTRPPSERSRGTILGQVELRGGRAARGTWGVRGLLPPDYIRRDQTAHIVWRQIVLLFTFPPLPYLLFPLLPPHPPSPYRIPASQPPRPSRSQGAGVSIEFDDSLEDLLAHEKFVCPHGHIDRMETNGDYSFAVTLSKGLHVSRERRLREHAVNNLLDRGIARIHDQAASPVIS